MNLPAENASTLPRRISFAYWAAAVSVTLVVRLYLFYNYYTINNDGVAYIEAARHFWGGRWHEGLGSFYPPGFPVMIALVYSLAGDWELAGQFWPFVLGLFAMVPLFFLLRRVHGARVAQIALLFYAVSPYLARFSLHVRSEMPYIFFLVCALYLMRRGMDSGSWLSFFWVGVNVAIAYLIRPEGFGLFIVAALFLVYRGRRQGRPGEKSAPIAFLAFGFAFLALPYVLYLKYDTGHWLISRKAAFIVSLGLAEYDPSLKGIEVKESDRVGIVGLIGSHPLDYAKKVFLDFFLSVGVYFEGLHYSYLPFLFLGWFCFFRGRFWEKDDFLFLATIFFYLAAFSLLYVNRRFAVPLVPLSLGWVAVGYDAVEKYFIARFGRRGVLWTGAMLLFFLVSTLPKTLQAIGKDKLYLREAALYLRHKPNHPTILTQDSRVAFYAQGPNRVRLAGIEEILGSHVREGDYLALDRKFFAPTQAALESKGWVLEKEFTGSPKEILLVFRLHEAAH